MKTNELLGKKLGIVLMAFGIALLALVFMQKAREDAYIHVITEEQGSCYLDDGTCLHEDRSFLIYIVGGAISLGVFLAGVFLTFLDRSHELLQKTNDEAIKELSGAKQKDEFSAFLAAFSEEEKALLTAIREQEGIKQSTLRYKTGKSKTEVSLLLKSLEERGIVSRQEDGKTKRVYLRKR